MESWVARISVRICPHPFDPRWALIEPPEGEESLTLGERAEHSVKEELRGIGHSGNDKGLQAEGEGKRLVGYDSCAQAECWIHNGCTLKTTAKR